MKYYDKIMGGILFSLVGGLLFGAMTSVPLELGAGFGGGASLFCMYLGMFKNAPVSVVK